MTIEAVSYCVSKAGLGAYNMPTLKRGARMSIKNIECHIVGMKYQKINLSLADSIRKAPITLVLEPENPHDPNAIAALLLEQKIGYLNKDAAERLTPIIRAGRLRSVNLINFEDGSPSIKISVGIDIGETSPVPRFKSDGKIVGIYNIIVDDRGGNQTFTYVGQSVDVNKRLESHWRELQSLSHTNRHLQSLWNKLGAESFKAKIIEVISIEFENELERQRWLAKREAYHINVHKNGDSICVNIMDAEIVKTPNSKKLYELELKKYDETIKRVRKEISVEINFTEEIRGNLYKEKRLLLNNNVELKKYISQNSGIRGIFKTVDTVKLDKAKRDFSNAVSRINIIDKELNSIIERLTALKMFRKKFKTRKQIDNELFRIQLRFGRMPKTINWSEISAEARLYDDNWREKFDKYLEEKRY